MTDKRGKIIMFLFSLTMIIFLIAGDFNKSRKEEELYFTIGNEVIKTWKNDGSYYLFLPSHSSQREVLLAEYSSEFYLITEGKMVEKGEDINQLCGEGEYICQFMNSKKKFTLHILRSSHLPSIFLTIKDTGLSEIKADKEILVKGRMTIADQEGVEEEYGFSELRGRGNTSFAGYEKKPFALTLNEDASLLQLAYGKKYVLLSNASDPSLIRNDLMRRLEKEMGIKDAGEGAFVDLYINGEYEGNYYLCEDIEISPYRLPVENTEAHMDTVYTKEDYERMRVVETSTRKARELPVYPEDITGGYLLEREYIDRYLHEYEEINSGFVTKEGEHFVVRSPAYCSVEQINYIADYVEEAEKAILSSTGRNQSTGKLYTEYIDISSFVKRYLAEEVSKNYDGGVSSTYYYKDIEAKGGKLAAGPGWDYDMSLGNYVEWMEEFSADPKGISKLAHHTYASSWYDVLYEKEEFNRLVKQYYVSAVSPWMKKIADSGIDRYEEYLRSSAEMNEIRWKEELRKNPYYIDRETSFSALKEFIQVRIAYLDGEWID